jgi:AAA+ ATPase superfamily predicted ATPase
MPHFKNPFHYGGRVSGEDFWDRQAEVEELLEDIRSRQHVIIFSQRRLGKTSLVWRVLEEAGKEGLVPVYVDLYPVTTLKEIIEVYAQSIAKALNTSEEAIKLMRELFTRLYLSMGVDASGNPQWNVGFDRSRELESFNEVISSLENYLQKKKKYGVVVFDEFQQILETNGDKTQKRLRTAIQTHKHIAYLFVGSKKHLIYDMFTNPNLPFYRSGKLFPLERISPTEILKTVKDRFEKAEVHIDDRALELILEAAGCHPYYTQYLCHILYDVMENRRIIPEDIPKAVDFLLKRESTAYMNTWDFLTQRQRQALIVLSQTEPDVSPLRAEALAKFGISQPSVMIRALRSLIDKDLVDKEKGSYEIIDIFFKKWIRRYISEPQSPFTAG